VLLEQQGAQRSSVAIARRNDKKLGPYNRPRATLAWGRGH